MGVNRLVSLIREADARIAELLPTARRLREARETQLEALQARADEAEAKILGGHIVPVDDPDEEPDGGPKPVHPMAMLAEMAHSAPPPDPLAEQRREYDRYLDSLPHLPPIYESQRKTDIERLNFERQQRERQEWLQFERKEGDCAVIVSNAMLTELPCRPEGPLQQLGYVPRLRAVPRPPWQWNAESVWPSYGAPLFREPLQEMWNTPVLLRQNRDFVAGYKQAASWPTAATPDAERFAFVDRYCPPQAERKPPPPPFPKPVVNACASIWGVK